MDEQPQEEKEEIQQKAPEKLKVIGTKFENVRMTITNWLLVVAGIEVFFGMSYAVGMGAQKKGWIFWVMFASSCFAGISILAGVFSHAAYGMELSIDHSIDDVADTGANSRLLSWDKWTELAYWVQLETFGAGFLLFLVAWLSFLFSLTPTGSL